MEEECQPPDFNNTNFSEPTDWPWRSVQQATDIAFYTLYALNFVSILVHCYVCWTARFLYKKTASKTHLLVASMTVADLIVCTTYQVRITIVKFVVVAHVQVLFVALMILMWISFAASGFSLLLLNIEKAVYFHWPLSYCTIVTMRKTIGSITLSWTLCTIYAAFLAASARYTCCMEQCIVPDIDAYNSWIVLFCIVPVISSGLLSIYLWFTVRSKRRNSQSNVNLSLRQQLRTMAFIFSATAWFVLTWVPARIYFIFFMDDDSNMYALWYGWLANVLLVLSPMLDPVLTITLYPCYRRSTLKWLSFIRRKKSTNGYRYVKPNMVNTQVLIDPLSAAI